MVVVPRAGGPIREYSLTRRQVGQARVAVTAVLVALAVTVGALAISLPFAVAYDDIVEENLRLKLRLQVVDRRLAEADRLLLRLRMYDAHVRALSEPRGGHGPVDRDDLDALPAIDDAGLEPFDRGPGLADPEAFVAGLEARASAFSELFDVSEAEIRGMIERLEDLRRLDELLPDTWPTTGFYGSPYGWRRHPILRRWRFHEGLDIASNRRPDIVAAGPGTVAFADWDSGFGRMVLIDHGFGVTTLYGHLSRLNVRAGQTVARGERLGRMGSTGRSTGPHLHFEVRIDGHPVDPGDYVDVPPLGSWTMPDGSWRATMPP